VTGAPVYEMYTRRSCGVLYAFGERDRRKMSKQREALQKKNKNFTLFRPSDGLI